MAHSTVLQDLIEVEENGGNRPARFRKCFVVQLVRRKVELDNAPRTDGVERLYILGVPILDDGARA